MSSVTRRAPDPLPLYLSLFVALQFVLGFAFAIYGLFTQWQGSWMAAWLPVPPLLMSTLHLGLAYAIRGRQTWAWILGVLILLAPWIWIVSLTSTIPGMFK